MDSRAYKVQLFGPFEMTEIGGGPVVFPARTASAIVAYLAFHKGRTILRRDLAQTLWPDHEPAAAMTNLRTALHRVRKATPNRDPLDLQGESIRLDTQAVETDLEDADRLHRTFLLASNQPDGLSALADEWQLRRKGLLGEWDFEWLEPLRIRAEIEANEVGSDLAKHLEASGDQERAVAVWREILERSPHHAEAMQHALRLEYQTRGKERAIALANTAVDTYRSDLGIEMPRELQKIVKAIRSGLFESIPRPELIRTRNELLLLARMFESNLRSNRKEALAMLAKECSTPTALAHPRTTLSLLNMALTQTEGTSLERIQVAAHASTLASWASEFEIGHRWADFVLENVPPTDFLHGHVLRWKAFMYFEQRRYDLAAENLQRCLDIFRKQNLPDEVLKVIVAIAGVHWHLLKFDEASQAYLSVVDAVEGRADEIGTGLSSVSHGNLCNVYSITQQWDLAVQHGRECKRLTAVHPVYGMVISTPLGLSLYARGDREEGVDLLLRGVTDTYREGMWRFNQIAIDFAAIGLHMEGLKDAARYVLQANLYHRSVLQHFHSPAERGLILSMTGIDTDVLGKSAAPNPLKGQSAGTLSQWVCEELERRMQTTSATT